MDNILDYGLVIHKKEKPSRFSIMKENLGLMLHSMFTVFVGLLIVAGFVAIAYFVLQLCFGKSVAALDNRAATIRWIYYIITTLAIPTTMVIALPALPRFATNFLARMGCSMRMRYASDEEAVAKVMTPKLKPGERVLAHFYNDDIVGSRPWITSIFYIVMMSVAFLALVTGGLLWSATEPFHMLYLSSVSSLSLVLIVWFTEVAVGFDRATGFLMHALLITQLAFSRVFLSKIPYMGYVATALLALEILIALVKLRNLAANSFLVLTNKGIWRVGSKAAIFPLPKLLPSEPKEFIAATDIRIAQAAMGERWTVLKASGKPVVLYPMFVTAKSLTACAKDADYLLSARGDEEEMSLGFTLPAFLCFALWAFLLVFMVVPPLHYSYTYFMHPQFEELEKDKEKKNEYLQVLKVMCKHHPAAVDPRLHLARRFLKDNNYGEAQKYVDEMKAILRFIPEKMVIKVRHYFWAYQTSCELSLRRGLNGKNPKGWEPKKKLPLMAYRKALLYLFSTNEKYKKARPAETLRLLKKAIKQDPKSPAPRLMKAFTCWALSYVQLPSKPYPSFETVMKKAKARVKAGRKALAPLLKSKEWKEVAEIVSKTPVVLPDEAIYWVLFDEFLDGGKLKSKEKAFEILKKREEGYFLPRLAFIKMAAEPPNSPAEVVKLLKMAPLTFRRIDWRALKKLPDGHLMRWFKVNYKRCDLKAPSHLLMKAKGNDKLRWLLSEG